MALLTDDELTKYREAVEKMGDADLIAEAADMIESAAFRSLYSTFDQCARVIYEVCEARGKTDLYSAGYNRAERRLPL